MTRRDRIDWDRLQDRWASGEPLSADEEARRRARAAADPAARRELEALAAMAGLLDRGEAEVAGETMVERVLERAGVDARHKILYLRRRESKTAGRTVGADAPLPAPKRTIARSAFAGMAAVLTLLAAVYAGRAFESWRHETTATSRPAPPEAEARLASASGEVQIAPSSAGSAAPTETAPTQGRLLRTGDRLRTGKGSACLRMQPAIDVCLGPDSDVEIGSLRSPQLQIVVARGVAVAALAPRAAGQSFALVGGDVVAVAHGTVYALDRTSAVSVDVVVLAGTVAVQAPGQAGVPEMVPAHTRWRSQTATRAVLRSDEEGAFAALLAPGAPDQPVASTARRPEPVEEAPRSSHHGSVDSPDLCLSRARAALDRGDSRAALDWYRRLRDRFPNDEAARTVLVTSGRLEMELGASARALDDFRAYLRGGDGALEMEALAGTARALRALGRVEEERQAIDRYLSRFANGFDAPLLRSRRAELAARAHAIDSQR
jgi:hypothetical protein